MRFRAAAAVITVLIPGTTCASLFGWLGKPEKDQYESVVYLNTVASPLVSDDEYNAIMGAIASEMPKSGYIGLYDDPNTPKIEALPVKFGVPKINIVKRNNRMSVEIQCYMRNQDNSASSSPRPALVHLGSYYAPFKDRTLFVSLTGTQSQAVQEWREAGIAVIDKNYWRHLRVMRVCSVLATDHNKIAKAADEELKKAEAFHVQHRILARHIKQGNARVTLNLSNRVYVSGDVPGTEEDITLPHRETGLGRAAYTRLGSGAVVAATETDSSDGWKHVDCALSGKKSDSFFGSYELKSDYDSEQNRETFCAVVYNELMEEVKRLRSTEQDDETLDSF